MAVFLVFSDLPKPSATWDNGHKADVSAASCNEVLMAVGLAKQCEGVLAGCALGLRGSAILRSCTIKTPLGKRHQTSINPDRDCLSARARCE